MTRKLQNGLVGLLLLIEGILSHSEIERAIYLAALAVCACCRDDEELPL